MNLGISIALTIGFFATIPFSLGYMVFRVLC
jgi:hypothetical protein